MTNKLQQRGCRSCGAMQYHKVTCDLIPFSVSTLPPMPVLDTDRQVESEADTLEVPRCVKCKCLNVTRMEYCSIHGCKCEFSALVESEPKGEVPGTIRYGLCSRHGFVETSHRCAIYDGQASIEYRRVETCRWVPRGDITALYYETGCGNRGETSRYEQKWCGFCGNKLRVSKDG